MAELDIKLTLPERTPWAEDDRRTFRVDFGVATVAYSGDIYMEQMAALDSSTPPKALL